jgi:hypothetical protein
MLLVQKEPTCYSRRIFFILIGGYPSPSVDFNEPALGYPPLLNGSPSLAYSAVESAIFSRAATGLALFHGKKMKMRQAKLFEMGMSCFFGKILSGEGGRMPRT